MVGTVTEEEIMSNHLSKEVVTRLREIENENFQEGIDFTKVTEAYHERVKSVGYLNAGKMPVGPPSLFSGMLIKVVNFKQSREWTGDVETVVTRCSYEWDVDMIKNFASPTPPDGGQSIREYLVDKEFYLPE